MRGHVNFITNQKNIFLKQKIDDEKIFFSKKTFTWTLHSFTDSISRAGGNRASRASDRMIQGSTLRTPPPFS
jgi:hypothetical protein